jgi:hypothetical protein
VLHKTLTQRCHSLKSEMTPSQHLMNWMQYSDSNYDKLHLPRFRLRLQRSRKVQALLNLQITYLTLQCPCRDTRDFRKQFTHKTSPTLHYLRGWSRLGCYARCPNGAHSLSETISPQLVPKRLLRNRHLPHGHIPRKQPLVSATPSKRCHPPHNRERNGIQGTHEGSPSSAPLEVRIYKLLHTPLPRHSGHPRYQNMLIHQTH